MKLTGDKLVETALRIATKWHRNQWRHDKVTPYVEHPKAVAANFTNPITIAAALLHDVVEDTPVELEGLLNEGIPPKVCEIVEVLTRYAEEDYLDYILSVKANHYATLIKIEDMKHNMSTAKGNQKLKYQLSLYILEN